MSNSHFKQAVLNFKVKKKSKTLCADECILNKQNTNCDIKLHDTITKHKVLSNENFRDANSVVTHNNKLFDSAIKVDKRFKTKHNVLKVHTIKPKKSISSSSPSKKIPDRPRRNLTLRKQNETSGLSWKEEIEINRALYASLQKNKSQVTFKDFSVEYLNRKEDIKSEANEDDEALFNSKKSSNKMTCLYKAQRKFASDIRSMFNDLIENKKNKQISNNSTLNKGILYTEDFINYLCLRGTQSSQIDADILNSLDINICRQPLLSSSNNLAPIQSIKPIKQSGSSQIRKVKSRKPDVVERILTSAVGPTLESADSKTKQSLTGTDVKQGMSSRKVHSISLRSGKSLHGTFATSGNMNLLDEGLSVKKSRNTDVLCSTNDMRKQDDDDDAGDKIIKKKVSWKTNTGSEQISSSNVSGNKLKLKSRKDSGCRKVKKRKMKYESSDRSWNRSGFKKSDMKSVTSPMTRARRRLIHGDPS